MIGIFISPAHFTTCFTSAHLSGDSVNDLQPTSYLDVIIGCDVSLNLTPLRAWILLIA